MVSKTIKISEDNYRKLLEIATEIQKIKGKKASFDDAINDLASKNVKKMKLSELAGSWKMTDEEWKNIRNELKRGWKRWKIPSV
ncbi:MAG: antitoxin VapB family protein [Nanoarchaeota archaeon]